MSDPNSGRGVQRAGNGSLDRKGSGGIRPVHGVMVAGVVVVAVVVVITIFHLIMGLLTHVIEAAVVIGIIALIVRWALGRSHNGGA